MTGPLPLTQYLDTLYPVARVLVGDAAAPRLVQEAFRRASTIPEVDRPADTEAWLIGLLLDVRAGGESDRETPRPETLTAPADAFGDRAEERGPASSSASTRDLTDTRGFRREVARSVAERALPVALAACSEQERALLTLHASGARPDTTLAPIAQTIAGDVGTALDEAYGELRAALRDVLTGPERMLIDTALPDTALESVLKDYVTDQYHPAPARLRSDVAEIVARNAADADVEPSETRSPTEDPLSVHLQRIGLALLLLTVIGGGVYGAVSLMSAAPQPTASPEPESLLDLSARRIGEVQALAQTRSPDSASAHMRDAFDRRIRIPQIEMAGVSGIGVLNIESISVPTILYADSTVTQSPRPVLKTLVYSYALIDRLSDSAILDTDVARGLETADSVMVRQTEQARFAIWRQADDIYMVLATNTPDDADALGARIRP